MLCGPAFSVAAIRENQTMTRAPVRQPPVRPSSPCPCGLPAPYADCCGRLHAGSAQAVTAEQLMRSRYSAFVLRDAAYLLRTWSAEHRPTTLRFDDDRVWTGLEVIGGTGGSAFHTEGTVEFRAHHRTGDRVGEQRENSRFVRVDGAWVYDRPA